MIKGIFIDLDGTLIKSMYHHYLGWKKVLQEQNIYISKKDFYFTECKKLELLYPFNVHRKDTIVYFDYRLEYIHRDDVLCKPRVNRMITNHRNKYCDLLLSIEEL